MLRAPPRTRLFRRGLIACFALAVAALLLVCVYSHRSISLALNRGKRHTVHTGGLSGNSKADPCIPPCRDSHYHQRRLSHLHHRHKRAGRRRGESLRDTHHGNSRQAMGIGAAGERKVDPTSAAAKEGDRDLMALVTAHTNLQGRIRLGELRFAAIVYECHEHTICGGLTDRMEGILVSYVWALVTQRALLIHYCKPGSLDRFYVPHRIDWRLKGLRESQVAAVFRSPVVQVRRHGEDTPECRVLIGKLAATSNVSSVVRVSTNHAKSCVRHLLSHYLHIGAFSNQHLMARLFQHLFQPAALLTQALQLFSRQNSWQPETSICVHIRYGGFMVDSTMVERVRYNSLDVFWRCGQKVEKVLTEARRKVKTWVVISDSEQTLAVAKQVLANMTSGKVVGTSSVGPVLHIDKRYERLYSSKQRLVSAGRGRPYRVQCPLQRGFEGEMRVFLDHFILSACDTMIGSRKSGFSASAAALHLGGNSRLFMVPENPSNRSLGSECAEFYSGAMW